MWNSSDRRMISSCRKGLDPGQELVEMSPRHSRGMNEFVRPFLAATPRKRGSSRRTAPTRRRGFGDDHFPRAARPPLFSSGR